MYFKLDVTQTDPNTGGLSPSEPQTLGMSTRSSRVYALRWLGPPDVPDIPTTIS